MSPSGEDALERRIAEWSARAAGTAERYRELERRLSTLSVTEEGLNGGVRVTVGQNGLVTAMSASDSLVGVRPSEIVRELDAAMRRAQSRLAARVEAVMVEVVGEDTESVAAVVGSFRRAFPEQPEGEPPAPGRGDGDRDEDDDDFDPTPWRG
ncbi:YbaB/EbfC family nucleoid-associated protein [Actinosynnema sp. NPDC004786]